MASIDKEPMRTVTVRVPESLYAKMIEAAVDRGDIRISDYLRYAIRQSIDAPSETVKTATE